MVLNAEQKKIVEKNLGLVHKVIEDKVHSPETFHMIPREDLFQIGCIGLCKAAATDKGGRFSTYAYRLIWNEICDALARVNKIYTHENYLVDMVPVVDTQSLTLHHRLDLRIDLEILLMDAWNDATPFIRTCISILIQMAIGYSSKEIGAELGMNASQVTAYAAKAKKHLRISNGIISGHLLVGSDYPDASVV